MKKIIYWLNDKELKKIFSADYWNNVEEEKRKELWMTDGNYESCIKYLKDNKLLDEFAVAESYITNPGNSSLKVLDLAAGIGWTSALISKLKNVGEVHAVEISKHRIGEMFEHTMKMLGGIDRKILRYVGSFYNIKMKDKSIDLVFLSQAFHHADKPLKLLIECDRVLKDKGRFASQTCLCLFLKLRFHRFYTHKHWYLFSSHIFSFLSWTFLTFLVGNPLFESRNKQSGCA